MLYLFKETKNGFFSKKSQLNFYAKFNSKFVILSNSLFYFLKESQKDNKMKLNAKFYCLKEM